MQFSIGQCYFHLSFFDKELRLPEIETYVFIGEVTSSGSRVWYFKNPESFVLRGIRQERQDRGETLGVDEDVISSFIGIDELMKQLKAVARRIRSHEKACRRRA